MSFNEILQLRLLSRQIEDKFFQFDTNFLTSHFRISYTSARINLITEFMLRFRNLDRRHYLFSLCHYFQHQTSGFYSLERFFSLSGDGRAVYDVLPSLSESILTLWKRFPIELDRSSSKLVVTLAILGQFDPIEEALDAGRIDPTLEDGLLAVLAYIHNQMDFFYRIYDAGAIDPLESTLMIKLAHARVDIEILSLIYPRPSQMPFGATMYISILPKYFTNPNGLALVDFLDDNDSPQEYFGRLVCTKNEEVIANYLKMLPDNISILFQVKRLFEYTDEPIHSLLPMLLKHELGRLVRHSDSSIQGEDVPTAREAFKAMLYVQFVGIVARSGMQELIPLINQLPFNIGDLPSIVPHAIYSSGVMEILLRRFGAIVWEHLTLGSCTEICRLAQISPQFEDSTFYFLLQYEEGRELLIPHLYKSFSFTGMRKSRLFVFLDLLWRISADTSFLPAYVEAVNKAWSHADRHNLFISTIYCLKSDKHPSSAFLYERIPAEWQILLTLEVLQKAEMIQQHFLIQHLLQTYVLAQ